MISGIHSEEIVFEKGFQRIGEKAVNAVIATGNMVKEAMDLQGETTVKFEILDLYKFPVDQELLLKELDGVERIITLEENTREGGMGSYVLEILSDNHVNIPVLRIGMNTCQGYDPSYAYGGREGIREAYGIGRSLIREKMNRFLV